MGTTAPIAIGTRGTVGSLIRKEIEYFRRVELDGCETSKKKLNSKTYEVCSKSSASFPTSRVKTATLGSLLSLSWRKKRKTTSTSSGLSPSSGPSSSHISNTFLPSMCSAVDVSESKRFGGFSYRNLKTDVIID